MVSLLTLLKLDTVILGFFALCAFFISRTYKHLLVSRCIHIKCCCVACQREVLRDEIIEEVMNQPDIESAGTRRYSYHNETIHLTPELPTRSLKYEDIELSKISENSCEEDI